MLLPVSTEKTAILLHVINSCPFSFIRRVELCEIFSCALMELYCSTIPSFSIFIGRHCEVLSLPSNKEGIVKYCFSVFTCQAKSHGNVFAFVSQAQHIVTCLRVLKQVFIDRWILSRCHLLELDNPKQ